MEWSLEFCWFLSREEDWILYFIVLESRQTRRTTHFSLLLFSQRRNPKLGALQTYYIPRPRLRITLTQLFSKRNLSTIAATPNYSHQAPAQQPIPLSLKHHDHNPQPRILFLKPNISKAVYSSENRPVTQASRQPLNHPQKRLTPDFAHSTRSSATVDWVPPSATAALCRVRQVALQDARARIHEMRMR
jgi:hypothetical protein